MPIRKMTMYPKSPVKINLSFPEVYAAVKSLAYDKTILNTEKGEAQKRIDCKKALPENSDE